MAETRRRPPQCPLLNDGTFAPGKSNKDFKYWLAEMIVKHGDFFFLVSFYLITSTVATCAISKG